MYELADKMNGLRKEYGEKLSNHINEELKELEMKNAKFSVNIIFDEDKIFKSDGLDTVEFMISTNVGEDEKKLTKIASGGEMSRFMLAIKNVLADVDKIPVLIFDEIDTGISGVAAKVTGEKIKKISKHHQVLCVTHLASIAAKGDYNYFISKKVENGKTRTQVELLDEEKTLREIARISSGNITEISIKLAKELRNSRVREIA
jgi:DNA repair protein RecN (Recombination protein N)